MLGYWMMSCIVQKHERPLGWTRHREISFSSGYVSTIRRRGNTFTVLVSLLNLFQPFSPFSPPSLPLLSPSSPPSLPLLSPFSLPPLSPSSLPPCPPHPGFHCHNKAMVCRWTASCHRPPSLSTYWHALSAASDHPFLPSIWVEDYPFVFILWF